MASDIPCGSFFVASNHELTTFALFSGAICAEPILLCHLGEIGRHDLLSLEMVEHALKRSFVYHFVVNPAIPMCFLSEADCDLGRIDPIHKL